MPGAGSVRGDQDPRVPWRWETDLARGWKRLQGRRDFPPFLYFDLFLDLGEFMSPKAMV